jgi:hypothetical protein
MKRLVLLGTTLALVAAGPAAAKNTGTEGGGPPFVTGQEGGTVVFHCKAIGGSGVTVVQQKKDPDKTPTTCTPPGAE